jgi:hypothetical protein
MPYVKCPKCGGKWCDACDNSGEVFQLERSGKWRGRFYIEKDDDGQWNVIDDLEALTICFDTKREAEDVATFARQYVRKWGGINFASFPYDLNQSPYEGPC